MPIPMVCTSCNSRLNAPDAAAGKRVKCPKCATMMLVPAPEAAEEFEVVEDAPPKPAAKAKPKLRDDDDDDRPRKPKKVAARDEDDEDDRPRKSAKKPPRDDDVDDDDRPRKKKAPAGVSMLMPILFGVAGLVLIAGGLWYAFGSATGTKGSEGNKWADFNEPKGAFKASFPGGLPAETSFEDMVKITGIDEEETAVAKRSEQIFKSQSWVRKEGDRHYVITLVVLETTPPDADKARRVLTEMSKEQNVKRGRQLLSDDTIDFGGQSCQRIAYKAKNGRGEINVFGIFGNKAVDIAIYSSAPIPADDPIFAEFISRFKPGNK